MSSPDSGSSPSPTEAEAAERRSAESGSDGHGPTNLPAPPSDFSGGHGGDLYARLVARREHGNGHHAEDRIRVGREIASGGQGAVHEAWDEDFRRLLAMKVLHSPGEAWTTPEHETRKLDRFLGEAQITGQLDHPGVVPVHEVGLRDDGRAFFTMKLVKGRELTEIFDLVQSGDGRWTVTRAVGVLVKVCEAMSYAHERKGVVHRDLKPANVMVGDFGEVYVMDWGLAIVLQSEDSKQVFVRTDRAEKAASEDSPLTTMEGDVLGTPVYMSPEQARGQRSDIGPLTDVYSVGAMLFHLLTGRVPHVRDGEDASSLQVLHRVASGRDPGFDAMGSSSAELHAICRKAMAHEPAARYQSMRELGDDLRAHLENRVVHAYESGVVAELKKNLARHRGIAVMTGVAAVILIVGLTVSLLFYTRSERQRANVLRLSAAKNLEELVAEAETLWPPMPDKIDEYVEWLRRARELVAGLHHFDDAEGHYAQLEALEAVSVIPENADAVLREHPRYAELVRIDERLAALVRAQRVRDGLERAPSLLDPTAAMLAMDSDTANDRAWAVVGDDRLIHGREVEGLTLARLALQRAQEELAAAEAALANATDEDRALLQARWQRRREHLAQTHDTLGWALIANGLDEEALEQARALERFAQVDAEGEQDEARKMSERLVAGVDEVLTNGRRTIEALREERAELATEMARSFDDERTAWWYERLRELVPAIEAFGDPETGLISGESARNGWGVEKRLEIARNIEQRSLSDPRPARLWREAIASISNRRECPLYEGQPITPQLGLLPIGRDPDSGLWEFAHLLSGDVPERGPDGLIVTRDTCIVLVLIPKGRFLLGTTPDDVHHQDNERARGEVPLDAFFMSKYEVTRAQWKRIAVEDPSFWGKEDGPVDRTVPADPMELKPVERVAWEDCREILSRVDLVLPTEAQWEYAARGGTTTCWYIGELTTDDDYALLGDHGNLADLQAARSNWSTRRQGIRLGWDDGWLGTAPVGMFPPNPYGLHDVIGNVSEWCRDRFDNYTLERRPGDGEILGSADELRVVRGGRMSSDAMGSRIPARLRAFQDVGQFSTGVRPSRPLRQ